MQKMQDVPTTTLQHGVSPTEPVIRGVCACVYVCLCSGEGDRGKKQKFLSCFTYCESRYQEQKGVEMECLQLIQSRAEEAPCGCSPFPAPVATEACGAL